MSDDIRTRAKWIIESARGHDVSSADVVDALAAAGLLATPPEPAASCSTCNGAGWYWVGAVGPGDREDCPYCDVELRDAIAKVVYEKTGDDQWWADDVAATILALPEIDRLRAAAVENVELRLLLARVEADCFLHLSPASPGLYDEAGQELTGMDGEDERVIWVRLADPDARAEIEAVNEGGPPRAAAVTPEQRRLIAIGEWVEQNEPKQNRAFHHFESGPEYRSAALAAGDAVPAALLASSDRLAAIGRWVEDHGAVEWCDEMGLPLRYGPLDHAADHVAMVGRYRAAALRASQGGEPS